MKGIKEKMNEEEKIEKLKHKLKHDIEKINEKLLSDEYINDYRTIRLKAMRTKCKELLEFIEGE